MFVVDGDLLEHGAEVGVDLFWRAVADVVGEVINGLSQLAGDVVDDGLIADALLDISEPTAGVGQAFIHGGDAFGQFGCVEGFAFVEVHPTAPTRFMRFRLLAVA